MAWGALTLCSFLVNAGVTAFLHEVAGLPEELAYAAALATVMAFNFGALRFVIFRGSRVPAGRQFAEFAASTLGFRGAEYLGFLAVHTGLGLHYLATIVLVSAVSVVAKFFFYRGAVFRGRSGAG